MNPLSAIGHLAVNLIAHAGVERLSQAATGGLIAAIWQGILLAVAVALGLRLLPKTPAAVRFGLWFAVFVVVLALPAASLLLGTRGARAGGGHAWLTLDSRWCLAVAAVWAVASLVRIVTLAVAALRVRALWRRSVPIEWNATGADPNSNISRRAQICTSNEVDRPTVIGFFSPRILIPEWLLPKLTPEELEQVVLHETGHLGRADDWMNLLQKIALALFPLNPALAWVERRLCFERELACDERVLSTTGAPKAYAECLATLAEHQLGRRGLALALGALGRESELGRRVRRILERGERMQPRHARLLLGGAMLGLLAAAAGLEQCPQVVGFSSSIGQNVAAVAPAHAGSATSNGYSYQPVVFRPDTVSPVHMKSIAGSQILKASRSKSLDVSTNNYRNNIELQNQTYLPHEVLLRASMPSNPSARTERAANPDPQTSSPHTEPQTQASASVRLVRTAQPMDRTASAVVSDFDAQPSQPSAGVVQWVVITTWQSESEDGSRVVFTTVRTSTSDSGATTTVPESSAGQSQTQPQLQTPSSVSPYAAVPVRGGWLVLQL